MIPTTGHILDIDNEYEMDLCIEILINAIRFFRFLCKGTINDFAPANGPNINIEITGDDVCRVDHVSSIIRDSITKLFPFNTNTYFTANYGLQGPVSEVISVRYIDEYDIELQNSILRARIALLVKKNGFDFNEDNMVVDIS